MKERFSCVILKGYQVINNNVTGRRRSRFQWLTAALAAELASRPGYTVIKL